MRIFVRYLLFPGLLALLCLLVLLNGFVQEMRQGIATRRRINKARPNSDSDYHPQDSFHPRAG